MPPPMEIIKCMNLKMEINGRISEKFGDKVELLVATLTNKDISRICYIKKGADDQRYFYYQTNDEPTRDYWIKLKNGGKVPAKRFRLKTYPTQYIRLRQILIQSF